MVMDGAVSPGCILDGPVGLGQVRAVDHHAVDGQRARIRTLGITRRPAGRLLLAGSGRKCSCSP